MYSNVSRLDLLKKALGDHRLEIVSGDQNLNGQTVEAAKVLLPEKPSIVCLGLLRRFA